jgi:beta-glucosidase
MPKATFHFPRGFLWGTATASHQVEGNNTNNNWWAWEQEPGKIRLGHKSGLACDWWGGRWREDFDRAAEGGQNAHRLSIEWSRVQPAPDRWDENALDRYREMVRGLQERNMTPMVTLHHFTDPLWLVELGGWENEKAVEYFRNYVEKVVEALKEYVTLWITFNEPNIYVILTYVTGDFPPGKKDMRAGIRSVANILQAHTRAYHFIHSTQPQARVGVAHHYMALNPAKPWFPPDRWATRVQSSVLNEIFAGTLRDGVLRLPFIRKRFLDVKGTQDFLALNHYFRFNFAFSLLKPGELFAHRFFTPGAELSDGGWISNEPEGMLQAIKWALRFRLPIIITENGINDENDHLRPRFMIQQLHQVWRAVNFNFPIKGYFFWTLVDNFEWERGWTQRFGLWALDVETQMRTKRPSADLYAEICKENGISSEMVAKYAPGIMETMFPG